MAKVDGVSFPILALNSGSSSIKFSMYEASSDQPQKLFEGAVEGIGSKPRFWLKDGEGNKQKDESPQLSDLAGAFSLIAEALGQSPIPRPAAIGHRMVSGGPRVTENQRLTPALVDEMEQCEPFAPLHIPAAVYIMRQAMQLYEGVPNFLCLDNWFHRDLPEVTRRLPVPAEYAAMGVRRYGAHGLSYESIVASLEALEPHVPARLIVAHLGNGASIAAIRDGKSIDTSMGLTPEGGLISGTRTGDLDPGALVFLLRKIAEGEKDIDKAADALEKIISKKSGLLGLSELTNDMRALREAISQGNQTAHLAVAEFTYVLRKFIGAYIATLGGLDMLVFTGGIGEHDPATRAEACAGLESMGIVLDPNLNAKGKGTISAANSAVKVQVIPAAEDLTIVRHVRRMMNHT